VIEILMAGKADILLMSQPPILETAKQNQNALPVAQPNPTKKKSSID
jgi:ABC-type phosphate/phosphonate transport system substrate-binding protein